MVLIRTKTLPNLMKISLKNYNEQRDKGYFLEFDVHYFEKLHKIDNDLPFLSERMKFENFLKLVTNLQDTK